MKNCCNPFLLIQKPRVPQGLVKIIEWYTLFNPEKTKFLMVGTQQLLRRLPNEIAISFLGKEITPVSNAKDLGIILDNNLNYDQHTTKHQEASSWSEFRVQNHHKNKEIWAHNTSVSRDQMTTGKF